MSFAIVKHLRKESTTLPDNCTVGRSDVDRACGIADALRVARVNSRVVGSAVNPRVVASAGAVALVGAVSVAMAANGSCGKFERAAWARPRCLLDLAGRAVGAVTASSGRGQRCNFSRWGRTKTNPLLLPVPAVSCFPKKTRDPR